MQSLQEIICATWKLEGTHGHPHRRESIQLCRMQQVIWEKMLSEQTHGHPLWREATQMCQVRKIICFPQSSEEARAYSLREEDKHLGVMMLTKKTFVYEVQTTLGKPVGNSRANWLRVKVAFDSARTFENDTFCTKSPTGIHVERSRRVC